MQRRDGRKLDRETQATIRRDAVQRVRDGESVDAVMSSYGLGRTTFYKWQQQVKAAGRRGLAVLARRKAPGRPPRLSAGQKAQLRRWVVGGDPRQYGFDFGLWTRRLVAALVAEKFGVTLTLPAIGRLLMELEITPQKPLRVAYERDPKAVAQWKEHRYPALVREARQRKATIFFLDESGFRADAAQGRTWGRRGQTPVVKVPGSRARANVIGAVTARGAFWYRVFTGAFNAERFVEFLTELRRGRRGPLIVVLDSHPAHVAGAVARHVESTGGALRLEFLPGYAPDLNPMEQGWNHAKRTGTARTPLRKGENFKARVDEDLAALRKRRSLIASFFRAQSTAYTLAA